MDWLQDGWSFSSRVSPFRDLRINGYLLLPEAFRSLSRLSSALSAKASTLRSFTLDLFYWPAVLIAFKTVVCLLKHSVIHELLHFFTFLVFDNINLR